ncbi:hypothetical protein AOLI_G00103310 [Acnodon oligacanthus]
MASPGLSPHPVNLTRGQERNDGARDQVLARGIMGGGGSPTTLARLAGCSGGRGRYQVCIRKSRENGLFLFLLLLVSTFLDGFH